MITRHHIMLGLLCSLIPGAVIAGSNPILAFIVTAGTFLGVILPDIHMKRPRNTSLLTIAWMIVQAGRLICMPLLCALYRKIFRIHCATNDKRLTHSIPGMLWYSAVLGSLILAVALLSGNPEVVLPATGFIAGLAFGLFLHLIQDACTRKGILPFFPFQEMKMHGSIRPCDVLDRRITGFHVYHGTVLFFFLFIQSAARFSGQSLIVFAVVSLCLCNIPMMWQSETQIGATSQNSSDSAEGTAT